MVADLRAKRLTASHPAPSANQLPVRSRQRSGPPPRTLGPVKNTRDGSDPPAGRGLRQPAQLLLAAQLSRQLPDLPLIFGHLLLNLGMQLLLRPFPGVQFLLSLEQLHVLPFEFFVPAHHPGLHFGALTAQLLLTIVQAGDQLPSLLPLLSQLPGRPLILLGQPPTQLSDRLDQPRNFQPAGQLSPQLLAGQPHLQRFLVPRRDFGAQLIQCRTFTIQLLLANPQAIGERQEFGLTLIRPSSRHGGSGLRWLPGFNRRRSSRGSRPLPRQFRLLPTQRSLPAAQFTMPLL